MKECLHLKQGMRSGKEWPYPRQDEGTEGLSLSETG